MQQQQLAPAFFPLYLLLSLFTLINQRGDEHGKTEQRCVSTSERLHQNTAGKGQGANMLSAVAVG